MSKITKEKEDEIKVITIKSTHSIAESNLMVLPFVSVRNTKVGIFKREWESKGIKRGIEVKGSVNLGVPTIKDLDVLLALFRIMVVNNNAINSGVEGNEDKVYLAKWHQTRNDCRVCAGTD